MEMSFEKVVECSREVDGNEVVGLIGADRHERTFERTGR
jgi:hypothetical protein